MDLRRLGLRRQLVVHRRNLRLDFRQRLVGVVVQLQKTLTELCEFWLVLVM